MYGTLVNAVGIVVGVVLALSRKTPLSASQQTTLKVFIGVATICLGLYMTWENLTGSLLQRLKLLGVVLLSMTLGRLLGRLLHLQKGSNRLGRYAREQMSRIRPGEKLPWNDGFQVSTILFCVMPLAFLGAVEDGLRGFSLILLIKAVLDALTAWSLMPLFGWSVLVGVIPVVAYQGTVALLVRGALPFLSQHHLVEPILATMGLLVFSTAMLVMNVKKIEVTDYIPSLFVAPALAWWWL